MPGAGVPDIAAYLDDGSGTYPYNVTQYVRLTAGIDVDYGRGDEFDEVDPTEVKLRLDNQDGRFSLGSAQYGCRPDQAMRITLTRGSTTFTYTGLVDAWPTQWDGPTGAMAYASISVISIQARLARLSLDSMIESEVRLQNAFAYYPLDEAAGSRTAGSRTGQERPVLSMAGSGADVAFAATAGPPWASDEPVAPSFSAGKYLLTSFGSSGGSLQWGLSAFVRTTSINATIVSVGSRDGSNRLELCTGSDGRLVARKFFNGSVVESPVLSTGTVNDGNLHHVAVAMTWPSANLSLYVDGASAGGLSMPPFPEVMRTPAERVVIGQGLVGTVSHAVIATTPYSFYFESLAKAGLTGFAGETTSMRILRICQYAGVESTGISASTICSGQQFAGAKAWDLLQQVAATEGGRIFIDQAGRVLMLTRQQGWSTATGTPTWSSTASTIDSDVTILGDKQFLKNRAKGTRDGGADQVCENPTSITLYGVYEDDQGTLLLTTDAEVLDRLSWVVNQYGVVAPRMNEVTVDLLGKTAAMQQAVLGLSIGSRIQVTSLPSQSPVATADLIVEGWSDKITHRSWERTFNTSPAALQQVWTIEDPTFGAVDEYPIAY